MNKATPKQLPFPQGVALATDPLHLPLVLRPGSQDHEKHPSRFGNELRYRDGRVEQVQA